MYIRSSGFAPTLSEKVLWTHFESGRADKLAELLCRYARHGTPDVLGVCAGHPLADDWRDFALSSLEEYLRSKAGEVYVVGNAMQKGWYKVGQTKYTEAVRRKSLNSAGVIGGFLPVYSARVLDRFYVEREAHADLHRGHVQHKEFFHCAWQEAQTAVERAAVKDASALEQFRCYLPTLFS